MSHPTDVKVIIYKAISFFPSVFRQFKIVKPTRQPGEKNKLQENKTVSKCYMDAKHNKNFIISFINERNTSKVK
jgi:hypothetical protein